MALTADAAGAGKKSGTARARNGAEALVQLWVANGARYLFLNPGTDTAPIQEAIVSLSGDGERVPAIVPCLYENVALAAAHGYFLVTREPQPVVVHVDVGTQNLGGNLHDAQRGQAGVVIVAGRSPYTVDGGTPGGRDRPIQWQQDTPDQAGIVRNYVKWSQELTRTDTLRYLVPRAFQVAASEPCGPVYMTVAREVLMEPVQDVSLVEGERTRATVTPAADPAGVETIARWLAEAERPVAIAGNVGRHPEAVPHLVALAELLGMPVASARGPVNIPENHPLVVHDAAARLAEADVVLLLDVDVPWVPARVNPPAGARIAQIDVDPLKASMPLWGFPVDLGLQADTSKALPQLVEAVRRVATPDHREAWSARAAEAADRHRAATSEAARALKAARTRRPISVAWLAGAIAETLPADAIVVEETTTSSETLRRYVRRDEPGTFLTALAPGLGWVLGAALGVKLAAPARPVIALSGDGSFVFSSPIAALWAARQVSAPFLTVVFNNAGYNASKNPVLSLFPEGASRRADAFPGVRFPEPPDYAALARSCHSYGERVEDPADLLAALERGWAAVAAGQPAVLDVVLEPI